jgi:NAD(P)-dependent dehydrogenase (short-subunit alcohol dehydrogenase family)
MRTWFITGVSSGFGRAIANAALTAGDRVIGTLRNEEQRQAFAAVSPGRSYGMILDVTDETRIQPTIDRIEREVGPIDVLVNNAGYGHEGTFEESALEDLRRQFDVNVFGAVAVTKALEGLSEALGKEVKDFGVHVTAVEPGSFRTDWAGRSMNRAPRGIEDYDALMNPIREKRLGMSGKQLGNPAKLGQALLRLVDSDNPPAHLLLGSDAVKLVDQKLADLRAEYDAWNDVALSTDFANDTAPDNSWA